MMQIFENYDFTKLTSNFLTIRLFAILMTLCVFKIPQLKRFFAFLYGHIGKGIFIIL